MLNFKNADEADIKSYSISNWTYHDLKVSDSSTENSEELAVDDETLVYWYEERCDYLGVPKPSDYESKIEEKDEEIRILREKLLDLKFR